MNVNVPNGYKHTKVGVIPEEWEALPAKNYFEKSIEKGYDGLEIYSVTLNKSWQKRSDLEREIGSDVDVKKSLLAREGYLVYNTMRMWQGALGLAENTGVISPAYVVLKPKTMIDPKFAFYQLKSYRYLHYLKSYSYGLTSDRLRLYFNDFGIIPFICPPLKEQQKIAQILTTWDKAISKQEALIAEKEQLKKGLMQKLLSGEVRFKGFDGEWEEVRLGDIGEFKTSSVNKIIDENEQIVNLINYMDVYKHKHIDKNFKCSSTSVKKENFDKVNLKKGDILFTPSSETPDDIGHSSVIVEDLPNTVYSYHLIRFRPKKNLDIGFSGYVFNNILILKEFARKATGSTRFTLSIKDFKETKASLPPLEEQQKIAQLLTTADKEIELLKEELEVLKEQKRGLMQKLLTGGVRVRV